MANKEPKQVIVVRKDLGMRKGKLIAQACHASCSWMSIFIQMCISTKRNKWLTFPRGTGTQSCDIPHLSKEAQDWIEGKFTKICVSVKSEEELIDIYNKSKDKGLRVYLITDSGDTEFKGVPTKTCLAIGPDDPEKIDEITGHLSLL